MALPESPLESAIATPLIGLLMTTLPLCACWHIIQLPLGEYRQLYGSNCPSELAVRHCRPDWLLSVAAQDQGQMRC